MMNIKTRAIRAEDKEERRHAILDAAERLLLLQPQRVPNVDEVASEAKLAKGTVYLYFPSKEELLLAIHDRNSERFFEALWELLTKSGTVTFDNIFLIVRKHMVEVPGYLPLAALCLGLMEKNLPLEVAVAHKLRVANRLQTASVILEQKFSSLPKGRGVGLLLHSYALIVGLWQLLHHSSPAETLSQDAALEVFHRDYTSELESALRAMWGAVTDTPSEHIPSLHSPEES